jgi:hypothetical protein
MADKYSIKRIIGLRMGYRWKKSCRRSESLSLRVYRVVSGQRAEEQEGNHSKFEMPSPTRCKKKDNL